MIRLHITDEQGTLLGAVTLDPTDINPRTGKLDPQWIGERVIEELPSDINALVALLDKPVVN